MSTGNELPNTRPSALTSFPAGTSASLVLQALALDGACILTGVLNDTLLARISRELESRLDEAGHGSDDFQGMHTKRVGALVSRSSGCRELVTQPQVLELARTYLAPWSETIQLHLTQAIRIEGGESAQKLHRDRFAWGPHLPPEIEPQFNTLWALTDFHPSNGATLLAPGSHRWPMEQSAEPADLVSATMPAGSVLLYSGSIIHGGGANKTDTPRTGINITYSLGWLRQEENQYLSCPPEIARTLAPDLADLLGYSMGEYALGYFSRPHTSGSAGDTMPPQHALGRSPAAPTFGSNMAASAEKGSKYQQASLNTDSTPPTARPQPQNATSTQQSAASVKQIAAQLLGVEPLQGELTFVEHGGNSLQAMRLIARAGRELGINVPIRALFEESLNSLDSLMPAFTDGTSPTTSQRRFDGTAADWAPLSFAQSRLWFLDKLDPDNPLYTVVSPLRLAGAIDKRRLEQAITLFATRHASLRTTFLVENERPVQRISSTIEVPFTYLELAADSRRSAEAKVQELIQQLANQPFDLENGPLFGVHLVQIATTEYVLILRVHHIISDVWSLDVFYREIGTIYAALTVGTPPDLSPLKLELLDYARSQHQQLDTPGYQRQLSYWEKRLEAAPSLINLPWDYPRPAAQQHIGGLYTGTLTKALKNSVDALAREQQMTPFMVLLGVFSGLMHKLSGDADICVGTPVAGRQSTDAHDMFGFFVNTLVMRSTVTNATTGSDLLLAARNTTLDALDNQLPPFEEVVRRLNPDRSLSHTPLFQVLFAYQDHAHHSNNLQIPGVTSTPVVLPEPNAKFDLSFTARDTGDGIEVDIEYVRTLLDEATVARWFCHFTTLLEAMLTKPDTPLSELPLLSAKDRQAMISLAQGERVDYPSCGIDALFSKGAKRAPDKVAIVCGDQTLSYGELDTRVAHCAASLLARGIVRGENVGLAMPRSIDAIVAMLAIAKTGAAYVPVDAALPAERREILVRTAEILTIVGTVDTLENFDSIRTVAGAPPNLMTVQQLLEAPLDARAYELPEVNSDDVAYVLFTSGSTGTPKAVMIPHRAIVRLVHDSGFAQLAPSTRFLQLAPLSFDAATLEIWGPLLNGGCCVIHPEAPLDLAQLQQTINENNVNTAWLTAALFNTIVEDGADALQGVRQLITGGEALSPRHIALAQERLPYTELGNGYGPTENTTFSSFYAITSEDWTSQANVPIGRPIANSQTYVLDNHLNPVPIGVVGELYLGGAGLALGYLGDDELTSKRFISNPFDADETRLYKSGDFARWLANGNLEFVGRRDRQIKLRGFRIELSEIDHALGQHPSVLESHSQLLAQGPDNSVVVSFVVLNNQTSTREELHSFVKDKLPGFMLPGRIVPIDSVPITRNGKTDLRTLAEIGRLQSSEGGVSPKLLVAPENDTEQWLQTTWSELLACPSVSVLDNFFDLGGHSLLAVSLMERIRVRFGQALPLAALFETGTIRSLAGLLLSGNTTQDYSPLVRIQPLGSRSPLFIVHPIGGNVLGFYDFTRHIDRQQPVYGLQAPGLHSAQPPIDNIPEMAALYIDALAEIQPSGPINLLGISMGGIVAFEMALQLERAGREVSYLGIGDTWLTNGPGKSRIRKKLANRLYPLALEPAELGSALKRFVSRTEKSTTRAETFVNSKHRRMVETHQRALNRYYPTGRFAGPLTLFSGTDLNSVRLAGRFRTGSRLMGWQDLTHAPISHHEIEGAHNQIFYGDNASRFAEMITEGIASAVSAQLNKTEHS